nr:hypothetical protein [Pedobacter kyonggii]
MDINNFGIFNSGTWGTVSDWFMVLVTAITARYIYKTLKSQTEVQKIQEQATNIENEKYRITIEPIFSVKDVVTEIEKKTDTIDVHLTIDIVLMNYDCKNISFSHNLYHSTSKIFFVSPKKLEYFSNKSNLVVICALSSLKEKFDKDGARLSLTINFNDVIGNGYKQEIHFAFDYSDMKITPITPVRIFN